MSNKQKFGQYFTTNDELKNTIFNFIQNDPDIILEPSIGRGDLVEFIKNKNSSIKFDMYEINKTIKFLSCINKKNINFGDFLEQKIEKKYKTIIGNPPYVRTKKGNLYIDFINKCFNLLEVNGELIFIVPSDFFKLTCAAVLLNKMMIDGTFTHTYHPNNENLFENASIDIIIFRYCKNKSLTKEILYNNTKMYISNSNGLITFNQNKINNILIIKDYFDVYVGLVSGKDNVYKNNLLGNIDIINGENKFDKYILINKFPSNNEQINEYLLNHKKELIARKIKKFNENNWFEWGAPRNIKIMQNHINEECIYIYNLTRKDKIAFLGKVNYFGGGLIMLLPKQKCDLNKIIAYLNDDKFKNNFKFSGRFKIGHRQIANSYFEL